MLTLYSTGNSTDPAGVNEGSSRDEPDIVVRDIHALTPEESPQPPPSSFRGYLSPERSLSTSEGSENFTTISREFNALVIAGSSMENNNNNNGDGNGNTVGNSNNDLSQIGEEEEEVETNPLAIVPNGISASEGGSGQVRVGATVQRVKREEVEAKITAWQNSKLTKINNRFKREDAIIHGWENDQVHKANSWMKKIERKLEEKRAKAMEKMQNGIARARRKAEERRATAEAKRGTQVVRVLEAANLMRAVDRPPTKRSFFSFSFS